MKITCQSCQSKYTVSDEKVQGKTVKIKCRKCGATILVNSGGVTTSGANVADPVSLTTGGAAEGAASYLVNVGEGDQRTMTLAEIVVAFQSSVVTADTYVWADGMADWSPLGQVEVIAVALEAPAAVPVPSLPPPSAPPPEPEHRTAARRDPGRRAQDLFGAKADDGVATSVPAYNNGSPPATRAAAYEAVSVAKPAAGQRDENSMLFSLSALTAKAGSSGSPSSVPPRATSARNRDDSGIIDLKALAAAAASTSQSIAQPSASSLLPDTGLFSLGAPAVSSPIAAPPVVSSSVPPPKSKTLFIGVGAMLAVGAVVGAFVFMKGGPPAPAPAATVESAPAAPPPEPAAPTATAAPTETAPAAVVPGAAASASASASAEPVAAKAKSTAKGGVVPARTSGGAAKAAAPAAAAAPAPAPKAGKGNCGCAAGDLMCAMKCSAH